MRRTKEQKGITLIALIITIVVLLILAVVAINSIQNYGIISHAGNTANTYNQAVDDEKQQLQNYLDYLDKHNGGSTSNPEEGSGNDGSTGGTTYTVYSVGDEVTVEKDGVAHNFYVIKDDGEAAETVLLLAKGNIDTKDLVQDGENNYVAFSTVSYWGNGTSPYDIPEETLPIPESHIAAKAAYDYGAKLGGKGRLMTHSEATTLETSHSTMIYRDETNGNLFYWLGSAASNDHVMDVYGGYILEDLYSNAFCGVRPVIEISKTKLS